MIQELFDQSGLETLSQKSGPDEQSVFISCDTDVCVWPCLHLTVPFWALCPVYTISIPMSNHFSLTRRYPTRSYGTGTECHLFPLVRVNETRLILAHIVKFYECVLSLAKGLILHP